MAMPDPIDDRVTALETAVDGFHPGWREPSNDVDRIISGDMPGRFTVPPGELWEIARGGVVETDKAPEILGVLRARGSGDIFNPTKLRIMDVDESLFVGGGMDFLGVDSGRLDTDIGMFVLGDGQLDFQGTPKVAFNRTGFDPSWLPSDELILCPTDVGDFDGFTPFTMGSPVPTVGPYSAEVMNMSRDLVIEGTPGGRSHILIRSTKPQVIKHVLLQHLGPRRPDGDVVLGRWGLHFHHAGDGSRGSIVGGNVARSIGSHAYVFHSSHGITARDLIAFECLQSPYWWDRGAPTNALLYDHCIAAKIDHGTHRYERHGGAGFMLGTTPANDSILRDCAAVGVKLRSGIDWRDRAKKTQWSIQGTNVSHNCPGAGYRTWHNSADTQHHASGLVAYHNRGPGVSWGAYGTPLWHWSDIHLLGNEGGGFVQKAVAKIGVDSDHPDGYRATVEDIVIESQNDPWLRSVKRPKSANATFPTLYKNVEIVDGSMEVLIDEKGGFGLFDLVNVVNAGVSLEPSDVTLARTVPGFLLRCQRPDDTAWQIDHEGTVTNIAPFYVEVA